MNVTSAAQKIQLKEEGHVLTKKYIDTLKNFKSLIDNQRAVIST